MEHKIIRGIETELKTDGDEAGQVSAVFSTFDVVDRDGDVVTRQAFTDGERVPMTWGHDWREPIGKGAIRVRDDHARFEGAFFMDTEAGRERYKTVKAMGDLQEWSWGFRVTDAEHEERDGANVRVITGTERFEVSPVLKGAGIGTYTQDIKDEGTGCTYAEQSSMALAAIEDWLARTKSLADLRGKDGRKLSQTHIDQLDRARTRLQELDKALDTLLIEQRSADVDVEQLFMEYQKTQAMLSGVALVEN